ncbi:MAG TPA: 2OG-Fe(II) oxygenase [Caulobacteraceae bacterium]|nr:2OG-Fe(II) oxygenase [Caulobacteraceae bacterium]
MSLSVGDRVPGVFGATADGRVYSLDVQAGRPTLMLALGGLDAEGARALMARVRQALPQVRAAGGDIAPLAPIGVFAKAADLMADDLIVHVADASGLESATFDGRPGAVVLDRAGRILDLQPAYPDTDLAALFAAGAARQIACPAPVLLVPDVAPPDLRRALIAHFEASPHAPGVMASYVDGQAQARVDLGKKRRRDMELETGSPIHQVAMGLIAGRVVPEIKRAFQKDIGFADRILLARYDDDGGYFRRHRDNASPQVAFREFAVSLNLNTHEYEGGELLFPEYDDHRYNPPAGAAVVFSASLLHEAAPVTRGSRYVLLTFLSGARTPAVA